MIKTDDLGNKILKLLDKDPSHPSEISRILKVPRTTIHYRLNRLCLLGFVKKTSRGRKSVWQPIYKNTHNKNYYRIYKGREIIEAYNQLLNLPKQTIILAVQGKEAVKGEFDNLPPLFIKKAHKILKRKGIIMKGISNRKSLELFNNLSGDMIRSHIGRSQGLKMFSNDRFLSPGEVMSTENFLLLSNPKLQFILVVKDKGITKIVNDIFKTLFELLDENKTFDLNHYLKTR